MSFATLDAWLAYRAKPLPFARRAYWRAQGQLSDPSTGRVIADVEGVEAIAANGSIARQYTYLNANPNSTKQHTYVTHAKLEQTGRDVAVTATLNGQPVAAHGTFRENRLDVYVAPQRPKVVGLAQSAALTRAARGLRCRESYTLGKRVAYTRFGECPAWAGPGKLCALDLTLTKVRGPFPSLDAKLEEG